VATSSISGLASGLDTATIIDQLMQLEAVSQTKLSTRKDTENKSIAALRQLNTDTSLLASNAAKLAKAETWQTLKATVTGSGVTATASASASATSFSVTIDRLANTHQVGFDDSAALDTVVASGPVTITGHDGTPFDPIDVGGGTLQEVADAINAAKAETGVGATLVKTADNSYRLLLESTATGVESSFTIAGVTGLGATQQRAGQDAQVSLGLGITATSATNTFTELAPGVTVTLSSSAKVGDTATVTVAQNSSSVSNSVSALVDQLNSLLTTIDSQTAGKTSTTSAGTLAGDPTARSLRSALLNTVFGDGTTSMAQIGIQTDRYGKLVFDADKFAEAYAADPAGVAAEFTSGEPNGWAARVEAVAKAATDVYDGTITNAITGRTNAVERLTKSIEEWDDRLALRRTSLERQYTALETALSRMQSQSSWLAGQIAGLPTYSS